jgi:hypothetical protein
VELWQLKHRLRFSKLRHFKEREGHCRVSKSHKEDDHNLGNWVSSQRGKKDKLSPDQIKKLDALGFVWDPLEEQWEEGCLR